MDRIRWTFLLMIVCIMMCGAGNCAVIRVSTSGDDSNDGSTWLLAKQTIQAAIDAAAAGDEIWVAQGTYVENVTLDDSVALYGGFAGDEMNRSARDWRANRTVLDGGARGAVLRVNAGQGTDVIDGFTIRNGRARQGAGVLCGTDSKVTITNNRIEANHGISEYMSPGEGGGVYCGLRAVVTVSNNWIVGNSSGWSGGVHANGSTVVTNNLIAGNSSQLGGGLTCGLNDLVANNTIVANSSAAKGSVWTGSATLVNNVIAFNSSGVYSGSTPPNMINNCLYNPDGEDYMGFSPSGTDILADPKMINVEYGELHLAADSPCIDAGDDSFVSEDWLDIDGQARLQRAGVDIGADEWDGSEVDYAPLVVRVSPTGDDDNTGVSWESAKRTIQSAIDVASLHGGEVWAASGVYAEAIHLRAFVHTYGGFSGSETLRAERNWQANESIIDAGQMGSVVSALVGNRAATIDGFVIQGGSAEDGGGVDCGNACSIITNNTIRQNRATRGGGIYCFSPMEIQENTVCYNSAEEGGGVFAEQCTARIVNNRITCNTADSGGGIFTEYGGVTIRNNIVSANTAGEGGGIFADLCDPVVVGNTIAGNSAGAGGGTLLDSCDFVFANNIVAFNSSGLKIEYGDVVAIERNCFHNPAGRDWLGISDKDHQDYILADPLFVSPEYGQYHIQPNSPCVDVGSQSFDIGPADIDGQPRVLAANVDIGADESDGSEWTYQPVTVRVAPWGNDVNDGSSWPEAKRTLPSAIEAASCGGDVWAAVGTYDGPVRLMPFVRLLGGFVGNEFAASEREPGANEVVVDAQGIGSAVSADVGCEVETIDNITVRNGNAACGGGVYCGFGAPIVSACRLTDNVATLGGGIYCTSFARLSHCEILGNTANTGAGIYCINQRPRIVNCVIAHNTASSLGGGIYCEEAVASITNNTIVSNTAVEGGGIYAEDASAEISNNIIAFNSCGIRDHGFCGEPELFNNCVYNPPGADYVGITPGSDDVSEDPLFVGLESGDYHLVGNTPCLEAGLNEASELPSRDMDGEGRKMGYYVDIGADEYPLSSYTSCTVSRAKRFYNNRWVSLSRDVFVTAAFPASFYIEQKDRAVGIRVDMVDHNMEVGDQTRVIGLLQVNSDGECAIEGLNARKVGVGWISPVGVSNHSLGGGTFGCQQGVWGWQLVRDEADDLVPQWIQINGLSTIGLLVRTSGRCERVDESTFTVDDGADVSVKCIAPEGVVLPLVGDYVSVTGISSCEEVEGELHRLLRVRSQDDIVVW